ncbi:hypothetical protein PPYR_11387 [Photinus pyralis]|uniref:Lipid-binding serum glycoprotein N-terminal domain-containing protein n=1 Tax=Photinus pyralis TaxID=7054 RepID=A0A5N4ABB4_PHOPY|nr:hypothetical protein PPYR_11387 [Photinus pyralis]
MKLFAVLFCLIACSFATPIQNERFTLDADMLNGLMNMYVRLLKAMDPLYVKQAKLFESNGYVFEVKNAIMEGFSDVTHDISLEKNAPITTIKVSMSLLRTFGSVELWNCTLPLIYGSGSATFDLRRVQIVMEVGFNMTTMLFEPVVFKPSIEEIHFEITGANNDEEYSREFSKKVRESLNVLVNDPEMHASVAEQITAFLNGQYRSSPPTDCWWCPRLRVY